MSALALPRARVRRRRPLSPVERFVLLFCAFLVVGLAVVFGCLAGRDLPARDVPMVVADVAALVEQLVVLIWVWPVAVAIVRDWWAS